MGTAIKGGAEGLRMSSPKSQEKMVKPMTKAIGNLVNEGSFNPKDINQLAIPVRFGTVVANIVKLFTKIGLVNVNTFIFDPQLKANNAYERSFDRPYLSVSE